MPVDRADVVEAELLEHRAAGEEAARIFLDALRLLLEALRHLVRKLQADVAQRHVGAAGNEPRQIARQRADRRRDRHVVVVEDDDQARIHRARVVHRLVGHAGGHRAVADHGDHVVVAAGKIARDRHAEAGRDRGRGVRRAERVVFALGALGEAGEAAAHAQRADAVAPPGENLVRIGLMADVPDDAVARRVEQVVQRDGQLDDAEPRPEVAAGDRDGVDRLLAQLVGDLTKLALVESAKVFRGNDLIEQGRFGIGHALLHAIRQPSRGRKGVRFTVPYTIRKRKRKSGLIVMVRHHLG